MIEDYSVIEKCLSLILAVTSSSVFLIGTGCKTTPEAKLAKIIQSKGRQQANTQSNGSQSLPSAQSMRIPIGTVHMVDQKAGFVLIKSSKTTSLDPETKIMAYGPDASLSSNLKVSPARKGAFLTADLVDGTPSVGDMVMMVQTINKTPQSNSVNTPGETSSSVQVLE